MFASTSVHPPTTGLSRFPVTRSALCALQGIYYTATGLWPILNVESFQQVTGRKTDHLVTGRESDHILLMTVAVLVIAVGVTLLAAAWRRRPPLEVGLLAVTSAFGLAAIDVIFVGHRALPPVYLLDAAAEVVLIVGWTWALGRELRGGRAAGV